MNRLRLLIVFAYTKLKNHLSGIEHSVRLENRAAGLLKKNVKLQISFIYRNSNRDCDLNPVQNDCLIKLDDWLKEAILHRFEINISFLCLYL